VTHGRDCTTASRRLFKFFCSDIMASLTSSTSDDFSTTSLSMYCLQNKYERYYWTRKAPTCLLILQMSLR